MIKISALNLFDIVCVWEKALSNDLNRELTWKAVSSWYSSFKATVKRRGNKNVQLVLQHCFKTSWKAMLCVLPLTN